MPLFEISATQVPLAASVRVPGAEMQWGALPYTSPVGHVLPLVRHRRGRGGTARNCEISFSPLSSLPATLPFSHLPSPFIRVFLLPPHPSLQRTSLPPSFTFLLLPPPSPPHSLPFSTPFLPLLPFTSPPISFLPVPSPSPTSPSVAKWDCRLHAEVT